MSILVVEMVEKTKLLHKLLQPVHSQESFRCLTPPHPLIFLSNAFLPNKCLNLINLNTVSKKIAVEYHCVFYFESSFHLGESTKTTKKNNDFNHYLSKNIFFSYYLIINIFFVKIFYLVEYL